MVDLIFGKDKTERIVSVEGLDDKLHIFIENEDGSIEEKFRDNKYWLLSMHPLGPKSRRLEGDLHYRYISEIGDYNKYREIKKRNYYWTYSVTDKKESSLIYNGMSYFKGMKLEDVSVLSFDIEALTLEHTDDAKVVLISNTYRNKNKVIKKLFAYSDYKGEIDFFNAWCDWVREMNPSVILGHNINTYDLPYMDFCAKKAGTRLLLGRNESEIEFSDYESKFRKDGSQSYPYRKVRIYGREVIDTFFLAIKYDVGRKYISYGLKNIIKQEELEKKTDNIMMQVKLRITI
ncbi:MAG: hypothetical protein HC836_40190 [Richelia sp. RM2_1_2]|nr:hypothetical protein [Richelia sp. RM2_1_2]